MAKPINQDQLAIFRRKLEEQRMQLRTELQDEISTPAPVESESQDIETTYVRDMEKEVETEIDERRILELRYIDEALQRMDAGHYGVCQDCGARIDIARLTAYPMARRCINCKQVFEQESGID